MSASKNSLQRVGDESYECVKYQMGFGEPFIGWVKGVGLKGVMMKLE